ncbi:site-specific integrase [Galbibacter sp. EGI 63066]|uniref:site-specific integrase n=1 Tax=Galbibacter sp. EGI 63066 TaxID=2993559 RepID=UPI0022497BE6|nr:site-specific integrase [Galbibacter sp. EGI 63066]MCX2682054.1 site-specific integrase [Galbibacter sp. EGI 63066]
MSASAKIILRKKPNTKGMFPLAIRITKNRRSTYKHIGHYIDIEDWDEKNLRVKKSHPNAKSLNSLLSSKLTDVNKGLMNLQSEDSDVSATQIKRNIYKPISSLTFFDYANEHLDTLEADKKMNRYTTDSALITYIRDFHKSKELRFQEINLRFLKRFKTYLMGNRNLTETSALNVMVLIRLLYNRAIADKVVSKDLYPFGKGGFKIKFPQTIKIGLNKKEITKLEKLQNLSEVQRHALNVWLFSFYFAGMRVSDVLFTKWSMVYDGRLNYRMSKNTKIVSLKIPKKAMIIMKYYEKYKNGTDDFIFPEMEKADFSNAKDVYNKIKVATSKFNKNLKSIVKKAGINKKVTMHIARHSFGNIAGDSIHPLMLQKLYRHSDLKTTLNYQANFIHRDADDALDSVINF